MSSFAAKQNFVVWIFFLSISECHFSQLVPRFLGSSGFSFSSSCFYVSGNLSVLFSPLIFMSGLYCFCLEQTINLCNTICPCTWTIMTTKGFSNEGRGTVSNAHHIYSTELNNDQGDTITQETDVSEIPFLKTRHCPSSPF